MKKKEKQLSIFGLLDWILSNKKAEQLMLPSEANLSNEQIAIEWGRIVSKDCITKVYILEKYDSWSSPRLIQGLKQATISGLFTVKFNYFMDLTPHKIDWSSPKMQQQLRLYSKRVENDNVDRDNIFTMRDTFNSTKKLQNKVDTFDYYNQVDLVNKRTIFKTSLFVMISGERDHLEDLDQAIENFKAACISYDCSFNELKADVFDWVRSLSPTAMRIVQGIDKKIPPTIMSDDTATMMLGASQGKIGERGIPLGLDVYSALPVLHVFREDANKAENILISAGTGGGKSFFVKDKLLWALQQGISCCILDYEGDEYTNLAKTINEGNPGDAIIIDMGSGNNRYFDPLRIADAVGDDELDQERKQQAMDFAMSMFVVLMGEIQPDGKIGITLEEKSILSTVLTRVYSEHGITDNPETWHRSKELKIAMIYDVLVKMVEARVFFIDKSGDDSLQKIAKRMIMKLKQYFVPGESNYGIFGEVLDLEKIRDARFIVFSFGNKGRDLQGADNVKMTLKQLCVSKITNEISNYNRYIKKKFTIKVWEEVQRFMFIPGAEDIMKNCITGGRKRGDIGFVITNDLASLLKGGTDFMRALKDNLTGYCIGYIPSKETREEFCETFGLQLFQDALDTIHEATATTAEKSSTGEVVESPFKSSFLVKMLPTSKSPAIQTVVKAAVHNEIIRRNIFDPGKLEGDLGLN